MKAVRKPQNMRIVLYYAEQSISPSRAFTLSRALLRRAEHFYAKQSIGINNFLIERKSTEKFLGVIIDENMTWAHHISTIKSKMARYLGVMYKIRKYILSKTRMQIFHSFVQSHLNYCSLVWDFAAKSH